MSTNNTVQLTLVDPTTIDNASALAKRRLMLNLSGELTTRDSVGNIVVLGGSLTWTHNAVVTNGTNPFGTPYTPTIYETVKTNPAGVGGAHIQLPDASLYTGQQIKVKNVTATTNLGEPLGGDDITSITVVKGGGGIDLASDYVLDDAGESVVFESDGTDWLVVG